MASACRGVEGVVVRVRVRVVVVRWWWWLGLGFGALCQRGAHLQEGLDCTRSPQADGVGEGPHLVGLGAIHGGGSEQLDHLAPREPEDG